MKQSQGFTLMEILIAFLLASLVILVGIQLYSFVLRSGQYTQEHRPLMTALSFFRHQLYVPSSSPLGSFWEGTPHQITFISPISAQYGETPIPVLVSYTFTPQKKALVYTETTLPPPWLAPQNSLDPLPHALLNQHQKALAMMETLDTMPLSSPGQWQGVVFNQVDKVAFSYYNNHQWTSQWTSHPTAQHTQPRPVVLRLQMVRAGKQEDLFLEVGVLSLSSSFGSP